MVHGMHGGHGRRGMLGRPDPRDLERLAAAMQERIDAVPEPVREALRQVLHSREQQHLAEMQLRRGIFELADLGVAQRDIAKVAGISQPEVSRRLSRRRLTESQPSPREIVSRRQAGQIDSEEMVRELSEMHMTHRTPSRNSAYDAAAAMTGTAKELAAAFQDGLITEDEYERVRKAIAERRARARGR